MPIGPFSTSVQGSCPEGQSERRHRAPGCRLLFLAPQPFFEVRGTPINVRRMVETLAQAGYAIDLVTYPVGEDVDIPGVRILRVPGWPGLRQIPVGPSLRKIPLDGLMALYTFFRLLTRRYAVVHAVEEAALFCPWLLWIRRGTRFVYDMDSSLSDQLRYSGNLKNRRLLAMVEAMERRAVKRADFVLTVCSALTEWVHREVPGARVVQIEDTPMEERFEPDVSEAAELRSQWGGGTGVVLSVYTGNLETYQGVELMLRALADLMGRQQVKGAGWAHRCVVVGGSEPQIATFRGIAQRLGLREPDDIIWAGRMPLTRMPACLAAADILLSPRTKGTNTALKVYGYMQSGRPILATDLPTHRQALDESTALLVPAQPRAFATGWARLITDQPLRERLGSAAAQRVEECYSLKRFRGRLLEAYASLD